MDNASVSPSEFLVIMVFKLKIYHSRRIEKNIYRYNFPKTNETMMTHCIISYHYTIWMTFAQYQMTEQALNTISFYCLRLIMDIPLSKIDNGHVLLCFPFSTLVKPSSAFPTWISLLTCAHEMLHCVEDHS